MSPARWGPPGMGAPGMARQECHFEKNFKKIDEMSIDELLIQLFSNIKRSYILPKNCEKGPKDENAIE